MSDDCEHDPVLVEDRDLPEYCWFYRCRKCGVEYNDPDELVTHTSQPSNPDSADGQSGAPRRIKCPDCPDGQVWNNSGPTEVVCRTCAGNGWVWEPR